MILASGSLSNHVLAWAVAGIYLIPAVLPRIAVTSARLLVLLALLMHAVLLAAGLSSSAAGFLIQADWLPAWGSRLWNTSWLLGNGSLLGQTLRVLVGYEARPAGMQLVFWLVTALVLFTGMRWMAARMVSASARSKSRQATASVRTRAVDTT